MRSRLRFLSLIWLWLGLGLKVHYYQKKALAPKSPNLSTWVGLVVRCPAHAITQGLWKSEWNKPPAPLRSPPSYYSLDYSLVLNAACQFDNCIGQKIAFSICYKSETMGIKTYQVLMGVSRSWTSPVILPTPALNRLPS